MNWRRWIYGRMALAILRRMGMAAEIIPKARRICLPGLPDIQASRIHGGERAGLKGKVFLVYIRPWHTLASGSDDLGESTWRTLWHSTKHLNATVLWMVPRWERRGPVLQVLELVDCPAGGSPRWHLWTVKGIRCLVPSLRGAKEAP